jgi:pimeloyl-ACP methyl ester carboxylesterase
MKQVIYVFSGLGANEKVFQRIHFEVYKPIFIKWVIPNNRETIEQYALRLTKQITTPKPILIGLSFGGIMAIEVAKHIETTKVILLASAKTKYEIPFYYRWAGAMQLHKLIPAVILTRANAFTNWLFGASTTFEKKLLQETLLQTNTVFLKWAMDAIVHWNNKTITANLYHIHGTKDRILPVRFVNCNIKIMGGGHFMTLHKALELSKILLEQIC